MKIVIFGRTSSETRAGTCFAQWRKLCGAMETRNHYVVFYERSTGAADPGLPHIPGGRLVRYPSWGAIAQCASSDCADADVVIVTSDCPDAAQAARLALAGDSLSVYCDLAGASGDAYERAAFAASFDLVVDLSGEASRAAAGRLRAGRSFTRRARRIIDAFRAASTPGETLAWSS